MNAKRYCDSCRTSKDVAEYRAKGRNWAYLIYCPPCLEEFIASSKQWQGVRLWSPDKHAHIPDYTGANQ